MRKLKTKSLIIRLWLLVIVLGFQSCSHYGVPGELINKNKSLLVVPYFDELGFEYHYAAKMSALDKSVNGILIVKKLSENHKRVVLLSDFGNTVFDFEYKNNKSKVIYVADNLNKRFLLNKVLLYFDFLTKSDYLASSEYRVDSETVFLGQLDGRRVKLTYPDTFPTRLQLMSRWQTKVEIEFFGDGISADSISFRSKELPLNMMFKKRDKNINVDQ